MVLLVAIIEIISYDAETRYGLVESDSQLTDCSLLTVVMHLGTTGIASNLSR